MEAASVLTRRTLPATRFGPVVADACSFEFTLPLVRSMRDVACFAQPGRGAMCLQMRGVEHYALRNTGRGNQSAKDAIATDLLAPISLMLAGLSVGLVGWAALLSNGAATLSKAAPDVAVLGSVPSIVGLMDLDDVAFGVVEKNLIPAVH